MATATLLLAEDDLLVQEVLNEVLTDAGLELVIVDSGTKALEELEADPARFRSVITDIRMGDGPDGWDVACRARELAPGIGVVYITGDSGIHWRARGVPDSLLLSKPFSSIQLVSAVRLLIDRGR